MAEGPPGSRAKQGMMGQEVQMIDHLNGMHENILGFTRPTGCFSLRHQGTRLIKEHPLQGGL